VWAEGSGTLNFFIPDTNVPVLTLSNVWYVPAMSSSIISVSALAYDMSVLFRPGECIILDRHSNVPLLTIPCVDGLYYIHLVTSVIPGHVSAPVQFYYKGAPFQSISQVTAPAPLLREVQVDPLDNILADDVSVIIPVDLIDSVSPSVSPPVSLLSFGIGSKSTRVGLGSVNPITCRNYFSVLTDVHDEFPDQQYQQQPEQQHYQQHHTSHVRKDGKAGGSQAAAGSDFTDIPCVPSSMPADDDVSIPSSISRLWHRRLGHVSKSSLERIMHTQGVLGLPEFNTDDLYNEPCYECLAGRHHAQHHYPSSSPPTIPLQRINIDITGPHVASIIHTPYSLNAIDSYTNYGIVTQIKSRKNMVSYIKDIINKFNFLGQQHPERFRVQEVRFDNPGEFSSKELEDYFRENQIQISWTVPYEHEQAGKVENYNRIIAEQTRSLLAESRRPLSYWPFAMQTAAYLYNRRVPKTLLKTPFEALTNIKPDISHFHVWGCKVFCKINPALRKSKEAPVTQEGIFLQYTDTATTYKVMINNQIQRYTDLIFVETPFPSLPIPEAHPINFTLSDPVPKEPCTSPIDQIIPNPLHKKHKKNVPILLTTGGLRERRETLHPDFLTYKSFHVSTDVHSSDNPYPQIPLPTLIGQDVELPISYDQALSGPHAYHWHNAIQSEIKSMIDRNVFVLEPLPADRKALNYKWVFVWKSEHGKITKAKARIVAKGFLQKKNVDYNEVFAPIGSQDGLRLLFSMAAHRGYHLDSIDIKTAFLYGELEEELYLRQPEGSVNKDHPDYVWKLKRAIYGLKQASRVWYAKLKSTLQLLDFQSSLCDPATFYRYESDGQCSHLFVHVDDIIIAHTDRNIISQIKEEIKLHLEITDCGSLHTFVGIEVVRGIDNSVFIHQSTYIKTILSTHHEYTTPKLTPFPPGLYLTSLGSKLNPTDINDPSNVSIDSTKYKSLVGSLAYAANMTRPDISYAISHLSRYFNKPSQSHWNAAQYVLSYLLGTIHFGILYQPGDNKLHAFSDADYASDLETRRSTTGYCFIQNHGVIAWKSHLQPTVALSTTEAEYMAANMAGREALWLVQARNVYGKDPTELIHLSSSHPTHDALTNQQHNATPILPSGPPILINCDNQGAIHLLDNNHIKKSSKHIDITFHWSREQVEKGRLIFKYIPGIDNPADVFTKPLPGPAFRKFRDMLGIVEKPSFS
jgi:hypothetical protein